MYAKRLLMGAVLVGLASQCWSQTISQDMKRPAAVGKSRIKQTSALISSTAALSETSQVASSDNSLCTECCDDLPCCNMCPCTYSVIEGLFMKRDPGHPNRTFLIDGNTLQSLVSSNDFDFDFDPGVRAWVGHRLGSCWAVEFGYLGVFDSRATLDFVKPNQNVDVTLPGDLGVASNVFHDGVRVRTEYLSRLNSAEVNFPCCSCWGCPEYDRAGSFEWFAGFRYISLREDLRISGARSVTAGVETAFYDTTSRNDLFGSQLGARVRRRNGRLGWEITGKAGIFGNQAGQEQLFIDYPNFVLRNTSGNGASVAFAGELSLTGVYQLNETWSLGLGYNAMWIEGAALAPNQLDFTLASTSGTAVNTGGGLFLHGVSLGVEERW